jgi:hypothetical protein
MNAGYVRTNLRYDQTDLQSLFAYVRAHDVERGGRYDVRRPPRLNIWTHSWVHPACRAESSLMFSLELDWNNAAVISVVLQPGYDWPIFLAELATLERAALGDMVHGRRQTEPIV